MPTVVVEMSGDEAKLWRSYQRVIDQANKLEAKQKDLKKSSADVGQQVEQTFGTKATASLQNYITGMASLTAAANVFRSAMAQAKEETQTAMAAVEGLVESRRQLLQVSEGNNGANNQAMNTFADQLSMYGISRDAARRIVFSAKSEGYQGSEQLISRMAAANFITPESAARAAGQVRGIYDKQITPMQAITGIHEAAFQSRLNIEEYLANFPKMASGGQMAGSSPAEAMAIAGYLATKNERGSEYAATFAGQFAIMPQFRGLGVMGIAQKLQSMPEAQRQKLLGTGKEQNQAYMWLTGGASIIAERTKAIETAMRDSEAFVNVVEARALDPTTQEGRLNRGRRESIIAGNELGIGSEKRLAEGGYLRQAAISRYREDMGRRGVGFLGRYTADYAMQFMDINGVSPGMLQASGAFGESVALGGISSLMSAAKDLKDAAASLFRFGDTDRSRAAAAQQPE